jgi:hypothetical protein
MLIHGSLGLGDAIYLYPVVKYFINCGTDNVSIVTRYPQIYAGLKCKTISLAEIDAIDSPYLDCHASARTCFPGTNIYEDTLIMAGITERPFPPLAFEYAGKPYLFNASKKVCVIRNPTTPTGGEEDAKVLIPKIGVFQNIINSFSNSVFFVTVGWQKNINMRLGGVDLDLSDVRDLTEYFGILDGADIILTQPGHCVPIAEALDKKLFVVFAGDGLKSMEKRFRFTTPKKILTRPESRWCIDDEEPGAYLQRFEDYLFEG